MAVVRGAWLKAWGVPPFPDCVEGELWLRMAAAQSRMVAGTRWRREATREGAKAREGTTVGRRGLFRSGPGGLGEVCGVVARVGGVKVG